MPPNETVLVIAAGAGPAALHGHPDDAYVIAADSGVDAALAAGLDVDVAVGDFDSVTPAGLIEVESRGALVDRHPTAKDATDLELALDHAYARRPARIVLAASNGGRLDHLVSSLLLLAAEQYADTELEAHLGGAVVHVVRRHRELVGEPGALVTLLAVGGPAHGVRTDGLAYPLRGETLQPGSSRGVSNVFTGARATVTVDEGVLLAILPAAETGPGA